MITALLISFLFIIQALVVWADNYTNVNRFFSKVKDGAAAEAYTSRSKYLTITRTIFFLVPPILGFIVSTYSLEVIIYIFFLATTLTFFLTLGQFYKHEVFDNMNILKTSSIVIKNNLTNKYFFLGIMAFAIFLNSPFILNFLAAKFPSYGIILVQANPLVTSLSSFYVIFYLDPKISKKIDSKNSVRDEIIEMITIRLIGRLLTFAIATIYVFKHLF